MDPITALGAAVNILTIEQLSAKVSAVLFKYIKDVKKAPEDIARLRSQVENTHDVLIKLNELVNGPDGHRLVASASLVNASTDCETRLEAIRTRLPAPNEQISGSSKGGPRKDMKSWFSKKSTDMKWPFTSKEVSELITSLQQNTTILFEALQIDET
jgi:hypothetical protein